MKRNQAMADQQRIVVNYDLLEHSASSLRAIGDEFDLSHQAGPMMTTTETTPDRDITVSRATQWQPLCEVDPTPGDADEVHRAGRHYSAMAEEIEGQVSRLKDIVDGTLEGGYVQSLTAAAEG
jgi:hypothetical protein